MRMLPYRDSRLTQIALGVFFVIVLAYAFFEARGILYGPRIDIVNDLSEVHEPFVTIRGHADRISELSMNGKQISVTEEGVFEEPYLLAPGLNRIMLDAKDKYDHATSKEIWIVYTQLKNATST